MAKFKCVISDIIYDKCTAVSAYIERAAFGENIEHISK